MSIKKFQEEFSFCLDQGMGRAGRRWCCHPEYVVSMVKCNEENCPKNFKLEYKDGDNITNTLRAAKEFMTAVEESEHPIEPTPELKDRVTQVIKRQDGNFTAK